ncbi:unnamed protein product, partial [marine sediment metagenome]
FGLKLLIKQILSKHKKQTILEINNDEFMDF